MAREQAGDLGARDGLAQLHPRVAADHELEHRAHRLPERGGRRVGADQGQADAVAGDPADRADEVEDALAALEPADVEHPQRTGGGGVVGGVVARGLERQRVADHHRARQLPEPALVGPEHVAARPQDVVAVGQRVPLQLVGEPRLEVGGQVSVEDVGDLGGGVQADADLRPAQPRVERARGLRGDEALAQEVRELDQVGPAAGIRGGHRLERVGAPAMQPAAVEVLDLPRAGLGDEPDPEVRDARIRCRRELGVVPAMALGGEHGHLGDGRQRPRGRGDVGADAPAAERGQLAGDERDLRALGAHRGGCDPSRADMHASVARRPRTSCTPGFGRWRGGGAPHRPTRSCTRGSVR